MILFLRFALSRSAIALVISIAASSVTAQTNVDLNTWNQKGTASNGIWTVDPTGDFVVQSINGQPTYFVSPNDFFNTTIEGKFQVQTNFDNDYIGFVFGYNEPGENSTDASFNLLSWKQGNQSGSEAGFVLANVNGWNTPPFSNAENDALPNYDVLAINTTTSNAGNIAGWADNTEYDFSLLYTDSRIKVDITGGTGIFQSGVTVFDVAPADVGLAGSFEAGQFGFYNFSQSEVRYESFSLTEPSLATTPSSGGTLDFLTRVGDSVTQTVNVANAGGAGTTLTGTVGSPGGVLFTGPSESAAYSFASGENSDFTYTYSPTSRTDGTPDTDSVAIDSNEDGTNTINLSGVAVGPVSSFEFEGNSVVPVVSLDFGTIDADSTLTLPLSIANVTLDNNGGSDSLTDLTIIDVLISGSDADKFEVIGFSAGAVVTQAGNLSVDLQFDPADMDGTFDATLTILTDQDASLGGDGTDFEFALTGIANAVIPEPASLFLLVVGLSASLVARKSH